MSWRRMTISRNSRTEVSYPPNPNPFCTFNFTKASPNLIVLLIFTAWNDGEETGDSTIQWADDWDDEVEGEDDFAKRLRAEIVAHHATQQGKGK